MTRLVSLVIDAVDHVAQARWWGEALHAPVTTERDDWAGIAPADAPMIDFVPVPEPKTSKNRVHLDLATYATSEHAQTVSRLEELGARRIDVGQAPDADWEVFADPEGNEFCVVEPRPTLDYDGPIGVIGIATAAVVDTSAFWGLASGWTLLIREPAWAVFRSPSGRGPYLVFGEEHQPKVGKNRIHLDVAPLPGEDHASSVDQLIAAGARPVDVGQRDVDWIVLADPGGNEFCVLTPR